MRCCLLIICLSLAFAFRDPPKPKCQPINVKMCSNLPYNSTSFPNLVGDESLKDAEENLNTFDPLINVRCAEQLHFFLCAVHFPMCNEKIPLPIGPCRPLCETVRDKCLPLLKDFGLPWPPLMNCSRFPQENNNNAMCMPGPNKEGNIEPVEEEEKEQDEEEEQSWRGGGVPGCPPEHVFLNRTAACVPVCSGAHGIKQSDRNSASLALFILCVLSTSLSCVCALLRLLRGSSPGTDQDVFSGLFSAAMAFAASSVVYLFSLLYREQISCTDYTSHLLLVSSGIFHAPCSSAAAMLYYAGTAGRLCWFVVACCAHPHSHTARAILRYRLQVQMLCWAAPLAGVMLALMARSVAADPLSGVCQVGAASKVLSGVFNMLREAVLGVCCVVPLVLGCLSTVGSTRPQPASHSIASFIAAFYPVAAVFYIVCFVHEIVQPSLMWTKSWNIVAAIKLLLDPALGVVAATACLIHILSGLLQNTRSVCHSKYGYQPAVPQIPQPAIPVSAHSGPAHSHTYAPTPRQLTNMC